MRLVSLILATWRLTYMLKYERGVFAIAETIRKQVQPSETPDTELAKAFDCFFCLSVWIGAMMLIIERFCPVLVDMLAVSAGAIGMDKWFNE